MFDPFPHMFVFYRLNLSFQALKFLWVFLLQFAMPLQEEIYKQNENLLAAVAKTFHDEYNNMFSHQEEPQPSTLQKLIFIVHLIIVLFSLHMQLRRFIFVKGKVIIVTHLLVLLRVYGRQ